MAALRLLTDMNISPKTVKALQEHGWDAIRVSEILPVDADDEEVLQRARREGRVVVTQDLDFSSLLALGGHDRPSLVTLRMAVSDPETISRRLREVLPQIEGVLQQGYAVTVEEVVVRKRKLPIGD